MVKKSEMTDEEREYRRKRLQSYLNSLKQSQDWHVKRRESYKSEMTFMEGVIFGLVFGIFGNLFVQYFYAFTEGIFVRGDFVVINTIIFVVSAVILAVILYKYKQKRDYSKEGIKLEDEGESIIRVAIIETEMQLKELDED